MFDVTRDIAESYFASEDYEIFSKKNNTTEQVIELKEGLLEKFGKDAEDEINSSLFAAHNIGEYHGIIQGIGIGMRLIHDCM